MNKRHWLRAICLLLLVAVNAALLPANVSAQGCLAGETAHYIQPGENLFRISLRYGVSMQAVAQRNGIANVTRIYANTTICIPTGATSYTYPNYPSYPVPTPITDASQLAPAPIVTNTQDDNWCNSGRPWGDGRCLSSNKAIQDYYFRAGWCQARIEKGLFKGTLDECMRDAPSLSLPFAEANVPPTAGNPDILCGSQYDTTNKTISVHASWKTPVGGQTFFEWLIFPLPAGSTPYSITAAVAPMDLSASGAANLLAGMQLEKIQGRIRGTDIATGVIDCSLQVY